MIVVVVAAGLLENENWSRLGSGRAMTSVENGPGCPDGNRDESGDTKKARWELLVREMSQLLGAPSVDDSDESSVEQQVCGYSIR